MTVIEETTNRIGSKENEVTDGNPSMAKQDVRIRKDYLLLRNYNENILPMREILLKTAMNSISEIEENKFSIASFSGKEKIKAKSFFQMDIISGIMMYIEDLIILSESFRRGIPYYKLLDLSDENQKDVGKTIAGFFESVSSFSDGEFCKIFGYNDPGQLDLREEEMNLAKKVIQKNITEVRRMFVQIEKFGKTHHPVFRRFKHAGAPLIPGAMETVQGDSPLSSFDSYTSVSDGKDPFEDIIIIPLSKDVLMGYHIIINGIQTCLQDLIRNQIICIERHLTGILPVEHYFLESFSEKEKVLYKKIIDEFYDKHPIHPNDQRHFHFNPIISKEKIMWYHDLPDFLRECKEREESMSRSL